MRSLLTKAVLTAGAIGVLASAGATAASAATTPARGTITAVTQISHSYDNGGGGSHWAVDQFKRTLVLTYLGRSADPAHPYAYSATIIDKGTFTDLPGQLTPNQGGHSHGKVLKPVQVAGSINGYGQFGVFDASAKAAKGLVPHALRTFALNANAAYASPTWPERAFAPGTTFTGVNEAAYGYDYNVPAVTVTHITYKWVNGHKVAVKHVKVLPAQDWKDTAFNGDGQLRFDGNITGR